MSSHTGSFVAKRFLRGAYGDLINSDFIVRIFIADGRLYADMETGPSIELKPNAPVTGPYIDMLPADFVSL
jgi:hypothetical protein